MSYGRERLHPNILIDDQMHKERDLNDLIKNPDKYRKYKPPGRPGLDGRLPPEYKKEEE